MHTMNYSFYSLIRNLREENEENIHYQSSRKSAGIEINLQNTPACVANGNIMLP